VVLAIAALAFVAWQCYVFFVDEYAMVDNPPSRSTYWAGEISGERKAVQVFVADMTTFDSLTLYAKPAGRSVSGTVQFELWEETSDGRGRIWGTARHLSEVVAGSPFVLRFPGFGNNLLWRWAYTIRISMPSAPPGEGIYLLANHDDRYLDGAFYVGGREQWGDLAFRIRTDRGTIYRNLSWISHRSPKAIRSVWLIGSVFLTYVAMVLVFLYGMIAVGEPRSAAGDSHR